MLAALVSYFTEPEMQDLDVLAADSAGRAIAILDQDRIDLLLSDINMPGVDGLELLRHVQANWPDCRTIFLTGFTEFDYIYAAKELGAAGFLLKTEGKDKIIASVLEELEAIKAGQQQAMLAIQPGQAGADRPFLLREAVESLLAEGGSSQLEESLASLSPAISLAKPFLLAACQIGRQGRPGIEGKAGFLLLLEEMANRYLGRHFAVLQGEKARWKVLFLLQPLHNKGPGRAASARLARGCFEKIQDILLEDHGIFASVAILEQEVHMDDLVAASSRLDESLAQSLHDGASIQILQGGQTQLHQPADENQAIAQVRSIIEKSYDQALSLTWLASQVYLNPSYLSRLFRQQTKMTLVSYINQVRLDRACELLLSTNMKVIEVAAASGFGSASYFNQAFRKHTGQTPADYRKNN